MRRLSVPVTGIVLALVASACIQQAGEVVDTVSGGSDTTMSSSVSVETVEAPEGWEAVDHPYVVAIMASRSIEPASRAVDGSEETSWASGADAPQWIELDLGAPMNVTSIRLKVDQAPLGRTVHVITAGAHTVPGMTVFTLDGETDWGDWLEARIDKTVQFMRITTTESPSWVAWVEIEIVPGS